MKLVTPSQMSEIDKNAINKIGIPGIVLMENAALRVVQEIEGFKKDLKEIKACVFAGKGNNGGDAFAVARHLLIKGMSVSVFLISSKQDVKGDALINLKILENMELTVTEVLDGEGIIEAQKGLDSTNLVIDGILGTGLKGFVDGTIRDVIELINNSGKRVISIDIPSGISGETGEILGSCIKADCTVTFGFAKIGLTVHPGCEYAGRLVVSDIGIPSLAYDGIDFKVSLIDKETAAGLIPKRFQVSSKGDYGRVLVVGGSVGMTGAACLAAGAALKVGSGLVYVGVPSALASIFDVALTETITVPFEDGGTGTLISECVPGILERMSRMSVMAVGPGLSATDDIIKIIGNIVESSRIPMVFDADALNAVAKEISVLGKLRAPMVVTPHPGEMARLMGTNIEKVQSDRLGAARSFSEKWGVITVLKGARTIVASPEGEIFINPTGNSGMATGGTGDVLTGIIAGLVGQGANPIDAAVSGVYLHGLTGDRVAKIKGEYGMTAGDIIKELPYAIKDLVSGID